MNHITRTLAVLSMVACPAFAQNAPPVPLNLPVGNVFQMNAGDTLMFSLDFASPEAGQVTDIIVDSFGLPNFTFVVTPGNTANVSGSFASSLSLCGSHLVTLTATDDGGAPGNTTVTNLFFEVTGLFTLVIGQPAGSGSIQIDNLCGLPGDMYFMASTDDQNNIGGCPKCGWWFGMFIPMSELVSEFLTQSPPWIGTLDANGNSFFSLPPGSLPPHAGMFCFAKTVTFTPPTYLLNLVTTTVPIQIL
jgi:hypothetical protein